MAKEIERKFLVSGNGWRTRADRGRAIRQAYLALTDTISLRVRTIGNAKAYLTIKSAQSGATRSEFEYPIPLKDARALMKLRTGRLIEKRRYLFKAGNAHFEIDVFEGDHRGLVIAEIELSTRRARFHRPEWLGKEVTDEECYYNANLAIAKSPIERPGRALGKKQRAVPPGG
jgi:adenylate cyclase